MAENQYMGGPMVFDDTSDTVLHELFSSVYRPGADVQNNPQMGESSARFQHVPRLAPMFSGETPMLATFLGQMAAASGCALDIATLATGLARYDVKWASAGIEASGSVHLKDTMDAGLLYVTEISGEGQGEDVRLAFEAMAVASDGETHPVTQAVDQALPTAAKNAEHYALGPVTIGGESIATVTRVRFATNIAPEMKYYEGLPLPKDALVMLFQPTLEIECADVSHLAAAKLKQEGECGTQSENVVYFRKKADCGTLIAKATEAHISLAMDGMITVEDKTAPGAETSTLSIMVRGRNDGTNAVCTWDLATAIA